MAPITFDHVTKRFDETTAVADLSIDVADGEFLVLVGPSGCGKTTALRMLAGLEDITSGRILIGDRVVNNVAPGGRDVAMVFQSYALYPHMTVYDNLAFSLRNYKVPKAEIERRVTQTAGVLELGELLKRKPRQLSGGQRQRVALARAVAIRPGILLLDEPLTALDAALRDRLRGELNRLLRALGITTIYVTHDQAEAMELGDRVVVMQKGVIAQIGTPREVYFEPNSRFVAEFIGAANIVEAPLENGHLVLPGGRQPIGGDANLAAAVAMIRPETIGIVQFESAPLSGIIDSVSFIGDRQRMLVSNASDKFLTVDAPNTIKAKVGEKVGLLIAPDAVRLLPLGH